MQLIKVIVSLSPFFIDYSTPIKRKGVIRLTIPHGGFLGESFLTLKEEEYYQKRLNLSPKVMVDEVEESDLDLIANGAYSPLSGFLCRRDYQSIITGSRLASGFIWTIPIVLSIDSERAEIYREGEEVALINRAGELTGILFLEEKFSRDKEEEALSVFGTLDPNHPGVAYLFSKGEVLLGGKIKAVRKAPLKNLAPYYLSPRDTREEFDRRGWKTVVAFQTRNPIHRAHEYLQKTALEMVDGLLIHPLIGFTKTGDIPAEVRMECYKALIKDYYPASRVLLSVFPAAMRYAGPKEAVFHAIVRKNYGCSHFIVGRDHAGVGNYYGTYDAQRIFDRFTPEEIGITILKFENTFYCRKCGNMASAKTCPHQGADLLFLSGTKVREMLGAGIALPEEFTRKEVSAILLDYYLCLAGRGR